VLVITTNTLALTNALVNTNIFNMRHSASVDTVMRTLADPTRRVVFERIVKAEEITVAELTHGSGVSQSAISQHLRALKQAGMIIDRAEGRNVYYRVEPRGLAPLVDWMALYAVFWRERFANLKKVLKEIDR
jgi:DNA-binding transcriptional ArsR family regulator